MDYTEVTLKLPPELVKYIRDCAKGIEGQMPGIVASELRLEDLIVSMLIAQRDTLDRLRAAGANGVEHFALQAPMDKTAN